MFVCLTGISWKDCYAADLHINGCYFIDERFRDLELLEQTIHFSNVQSYKILKSDFIESSEKIAKLHSKKSLKAIKKAKAAKQFTALKKIVENPKNYDELVFMNGINQ